MSWPKQNPICYNPPTQQKTKKNKKTGFVLDFSYSVISPIQAYPLSLVNPVSKPLKSIHCSPSLIPPHSSSPHQVMCSSFLKKKKKKLWIWLCQVLAAAHRSFGPHRSIPRGSSVEACGLLVAAYGIEFPNKGSNVGPPALGARGTSHLTTRELPASPS